MDSGDRLMVEGFAAVAVIFGLALWALGGKRPHYAWLERLQRVHMGPTKQVAIVIVVLMGLAIMTVILVDTFTKPHRTPQEVER